VRAYINGAQVFSFVDSANEAVFSAANNIVRFFQDDVVTGQLDAESGFVDRIRLYDGVLSASAVADLYNPPPPPPAIPDFDQRGEPFGRVVDSDGNGNARMDMGAYELQGTPAFFVAKGDYNLDGNVDAADYIAWRKTFGTSVPNGTGADGDGDGVVDQDDYNVWRTNSGTSPYAPGAGSGSSFMLAAGGIAESFEAEPASGFSSGRSVPDEAIAAPIAAAPRSDVFVQFAAPAKVVKHTVSTDKSGAASSSLTLHESGLLAWVASHNDEARVALAHASLERAEHPGEEFDSSDAGDDAIDLAHAMLGEIL
jgi:hypothetical protein